MAVEKAASTPIIHTREEWLERRTRGIGASDVGAILGLSKWRDHLEVWAAKTGRAERRDPSLRMRLGTALEPFIAEEFERETQMRLLDPGPFTVYQDRQNPHWFCTPDRLLAQDSRTPVELKSVHPFQAEDWAAPWAPLEYQAQLQFQIHILGAEHGYLAGLLDDEIAVRHFKRNEKFLSVMLARLDEFWCYVEQDEEPPPDWNRKIAINGFKLLHPDDNGETVPLPADMLEPIQRMLDDQEIVKQLQKRIDGVKARIVAAIGDATYGEVGPYRFSYKTQERAAHEVRASKFRVLRQVKK